jgi:hypothetical protein
MAVINNAIGTESIMGMLKKYKIEDESASALYNRLKLPYLPSISDGLVLDSLSSYADHVRLNTQH